MKDRVLLEMSLPRKKAEQIVTGLEQQLNFHLLKLLAFQASDDVRNHWKREISSWLLRIAGISLKPDNKPLPKRLVFQWLYEEPFGGTEIKNTEMILNYLSMDYTRNAVDTATIAQRLREIQEQIAQHVSMKNPALDIIEKL